MAGPTKGIFFDLKEENFRRGERRRFKEIRHRSFRAVRANCNLMNLSKCHYYVVSKFHCSSPIHVFIPWKINLIVIILL